ncbi:speriolin [Dasypus novemcinctus]|uniref:speriolin n=1 Tax=Dasypus novemcinctus TaxID=9361 RepID=UPI00265D62A5|nr:speriolin [Dasypus novemcinctus]
MGRATAEGDTCWGGQRAGTAFPWVTSRFGGGSLRAKLAGQRRHSRAQARRHGERSLLEHRPRRRAQPLTSQYPGPCWASLASSGAPHPQPGQGPGPWAASPVQPPPRAAPSPLPRGMSLLTNYEGLRHQIERLVRENEELKKLVRLIRENHELKSAIKTQAGDLGISGFTGGLGEATAGPPRQGVFLPSPPAAANEARLEDMGSVALAPLADMLASPQPGPAVAPLAGALNTLLSCPGAVSQSRPLSSLLTGSLPSSGAPASTLTSNLGLPSTGPLTGHLSSPLAMAPVGTLTGHLGLPPNSHLSSPLLAPMAGPVTGPLGSALLSPPAAPLAVPQGLLNPMSVAVLEGPKLRLAEPLVGYPARAPPSAGAGHTASSKALLPEQPRPTQDPETGGLEFVGAPIQASTPISAADVPGPVPTFAFNAADPQAQPSAPQGQPAPAPTPSATPALLTVPAPAPQAAATSHSPSGTGVAQQAPSAPRQPSPTRSSHSSPPTSTSPPSACDARSPRTAEPARKSILELERKLARRKASKFPEGPREQRQVSWERLVGEIAFQLDRRILSSIFPERVRLYGFTVSNIPEKIIQASLNPSDHKLDEELCQTLTQRYVSIMNRLQGLGYNGRVHPALTEQLVNAYGILRERPELAASEGGAYTVDFLQRVLVETVHPGMLTDALLLLSCLSQLAHDDGKPMFIW